MLEFIPYPIVYYPMMEQRQRQALIEGLAITIIGLFLSHAAADQKVTTMDNKNSGTACTLPKNDEELRKLLSPEQYRIVRENGTEAPFKNAYWDNKKAGIYVDVVSGEPLFSSLDKFDSGTGWPSFTKPIKKEDVVEKKDTQYGVVRTEVRSNKGDSHLGHVFNDGPGPDGLRYCINSGSLRFVPLEELETAGYGEYLGLFK